MLDWVALSAFASTYVGMALGRIPGLRLDRTGIALLAMVALLASGRTTEREAGAFIDMPTLLLLFALMIVSAQFQIAGVYETVASRLATAKGSGKHLLLLTVMVAGALSTVLANDIVVFAITPIIAAGIRLRGQDPRPHLLGLAGAANAGSAMTIIGNPQNILIGQVGGLDFWRFLVVCGVPAMASLIIVYLSVRWLWRTSLAAPPAEPPPLTPPSLDRWQTAKGVVAMVGLMALFATPLPREIGALVIAGLLLMSRRLASRKMLAAVDWHLLLLFACLFVVTGTFSTTGLASEGVRWLADAGLLPERLSVMAPLVLVASNTIGNVPATMLVLSVWPAPSSGSLYALALLSTLAGNFLLLGSLANIIVVERAASVGVRLGFADFARAGMPMTLGSMAIAMLWLWLGGWMGW